MDWSDMEKQIHENAVKHGWWEKNSEGRTRSTSEIIALVHSEWSEALESYRNGEQMIWIDASGERPKPEGVFVELIDGCIRLMDAAAAWDMYVYATLVSESFVHMTLPTLVCELHDKTALLRMEVSLREKATETINAILGIVWAWVKWHGGDPEGILKEKHEYNKTRSYKHGGKVI